MTVLALDTPIIAAPMAGGISTPALVAAAESAGALGFLAAGYQRPDQLHDQIVRTRALGCQRFGVNVFVPEFGTPDLAAARAYREALVPLASKFDVDLPEPVADDDHWQEKLRLLVADPVPLVSFTFGCPEPAAISDLHQAGSAVWITVTTPQEAEQATHAGADALIVQGPDAGGHRATFTNTAPDTTPLLTLLESVRRVTALPLIAAGGLSTPTGVHEALALADAAQIGTALLDATEADTNATHRRALHDPAYTETVVTRAFSGRPARGLRNRFIEEFDTLAPAAYPAVNQITGPIRRAAAATDDPEHLHLWAGTGWRAIHTAPAAEIIAILAGRP